MREYFVDRPSERVAEDELQLATAPPAREVSRGEVARLQRELRESIMARTSYHRGERGTLRKAFADFDTDSTGLIDITEFSRALERFGLHTAEHGLKGGAGGVSRELVQALFNSFDTDRSGSLDYAEFEEALLQPERPHPPPMINTKPRMRGAGAGYNG